MWYRQMRSTVAFLKGLLRNLINLLEKHLRDLVHGFPWQTLISVTAISGSISWSTEKISAKGIIQAMHTFCCAQVCVYEHACVYASVHILVSFLRSHLPWFLRQSLLLACPQPPTALGWLTSESQRIHPASAFQQWLEQSAFTHRSGDSNLHPHCTTSKLYQGNSAAS